MLKRKIVLCVFLVFCVALCCNCGFFESEKYVCEAEQVVLVEIIELGEYIDDESNFEYILLREIKNEDVSEFVKRLNNVEHKERKWGAPGGVYEGCVIIKVSYLNGDYDIIHQGAQSFSRSGNQKRGFFTFNSDQFEELLNDYLS